MRFSRKIVDGVFSLSKLLNLQIDSNCLLINRNVHVKPVNTYTYRTHTCGEITVKDVDQMVTVCGWLQFQRMNQFAILRDAYGLIQAYVPNERNDIKTLLNKTPLESVIKITGKVLKRPEAQINKKMQSGEVEVLVNHFEVLNSVKLSLPFTVRDHNRANEATRMKYRYLDLRYPDMQRNLRLRSEIIMKMRNFLINHKFIEVETPTLFKKTPGGAQEFIVPTHIPGEFYSLVQSPQQLKQLLMVGGIDRYFQVARCYRDEGARPDRQPEFTQLDLEMSFTSAEGVMSLIEDLLISCWPEQYNQLVKPFQKLTYKEAMQKYGTDQPNFLSKFPIVNFDQGNAATAIRAIIIPNGSEYVTHSFRKICESLRKQYFADVKLLMVIYKDSERWRTDLNKVQAGVEEIKLENSGVKPNDFIFLVAGQESNALKLLGKIRSLFINFIKEKSIDKEINNEQVFTPFWIIDFPLFEEGDQPGTLKPVHHPFTSPHPEDLHLVRSHPRMVRGLHYDLVLNGYEIGGGSVRIHDPELQDHILTRILKYPREDLNHMLEALGSGAPPHAGIALGVDRLIAILVKVQSIRDVIAFPKTTEGRDHLGGAPSKISQNDLDFYRIRISPTVRTPFKK